MNAVNSRGRVMMVFGSLNRAKQGVCWHKGRSSPVPKIYKPCSQGPSKDGVHRYPPFCSQGGHREGENTPLSTLIAFLGPKGEREDWLQPRKNPNLLGKGTLVLSPSPSAQVSNTKEEPVREKRNISSNWCTGPVVHKSLQWDLEANSKLSQLFSNWGIASRW